MPEVTCDFSVPLTVRVNTDTGEADEVWLHLDGFQDVPSGYFVGVPKGRLRGWLTRKLAGGYPTMFRNAFSEAIDGEYAVDGESPVGDQALAIADRVELLQPEFSVAFTLAPPG